MNTFYFTYGSNHVDESGASLGQCYTPVTVVPHDDYDHMEGIDAARAMMFAARDDKWSRQYYSSEDAGVERHGLIERSLESVAFDRQRMKRALIAQTLAEERRKLTSALLACDRAAAVMERMPIEVIDSCIIHSNTGELIIFGLTRELVKETITTMHAGKWSKRINPSYPTRLDYDAVIDGVKMQIYSVPPPESCRIVEREEEVPAHKKIIRELVCA